MQNPHNTLSWMQENDMKNEFNKDLLSKKYTGLSRHRRNKPLGVKNPKSIVTTKRTAILYMKNQGKI